MGHRKMALLVNSVKKCFRKYPAVSNCIAYGSLFVTAEFSQQTVVKKFLPWKEGAADLTKCSWQIYSPLSRAEWSNNTYTVQCTVVSLWGRSLERYDWKMLQRYVILGTLVHPN